MPLKYFIHTFGCQMNVHDSSKMEGILSKMGYLPAHDDKDADIILFNTCTVRDHAHHKAISEIGRVVHMKERRPDLIVGVCGCVAQLEKERLFEKFPELDIVFGPDQIARLEETLKDEGRRTRDERTATTELIDNVDEYDWLKNTIAPSHLRTFAPVSAFVTIMKGCNNNCSFCIVPAVRGREVSKPAEMIIDEINELVAQGVKEVTLLGQNVNSYRNGSFVNLLKRISDETDILRIRYTSPHPKDLNDGLIEEHAQNKKLCAHMHLPLQAGSDKILRAMKRSYNKEQFIKKASLLRCAVPNIDITTDIIVGFPGESEVDFQDTLDIVKESSFDGMFAFKYSPRPGTASASLKDDVPKSEKEERLQRLLELNAKVWKEKVEKLVGTGQEVLIEGISKKGMRTNVQLTGRTFANKIVNFAGNLNLIGHIVRVLIKSAGANSLKGELL